ncbi:hypothetical protein N183_32675 [Sinorhizobium sp. Sb3]|nr:hypothetical protein N183_32675 [Sinorhizobium sp. Sb3]
MRSKPDLEIDVAWTSSRFLELADLLGFDPHEALDQLSRIKG